jgi:hypothetical protein
MGLSLPEPFDNLNTNKVWRSKREGYHKMTWKIKWEWFQSIFLKKKTWVWEIISQSKDYLSCWEELLSKQTFSSKIFKQYWKNKIRWKRCKRYLCGWVLQNLCLSREKKTYPDEDGQCNHVLLQQHAVWTLLVELFEGGTNVLWGLDRWRVSPSVPFFKVVGNECIQKLVFTRTNEAECRCWW